MIRALIGLVILAIAVAVCWGVLVVGQAHALAWITAAVGAERASDPPTVESLFNVIIFAPLIVVAVIGGMLERRNALRLGTRPALSLGVGLIVGLAGLSATVLYAWLAGVLTAGGDPGAGAGLLLWGLGVTAFQVAAEEIYFRGWLQPALTMRWGQVAGVGAAALAFGALHVAGGAREPVSLVNLFLGGVMFGLFALRGGGLAAAFGAHFAWNAVEQLAWGLDPNPGIGSFGAVVDKELVGAAIWGGSGEGLNGSIGMTIALLAIVLPLALLSWRRVSGATPAAVAKPTTPPATAPVARAA
ncbi:type II CAAX prenyl endopeptidase Rce1 family protein [Sphingomonas sp.]|uniref:CPBP family glutamic-type intramembrane protease n=1 Tax=Sphingomonas sp. TaxID=28214 RepID=UPI003AFFF3F9